jgi:NDP-sugar pyrophosphorylase family protein
MPNKPLLPIRDGDIVIESAIRWLKEVNDIDDIVVVIDPTRIVQRVLHKRGWVDLKYVVQPEAYGVSDAIARAAPLVGDRAVVAFGDNIYSPKEIIDSKTLRTPCASIRRIASNQLDYYAGERWCMRNDEAGTQMKLAGWLLLDREHMESGTVDESLVAMLNRIKATGIPFTHEWHDVGTVDSYTRYLDS